MATVARDLWEVSPLPRFSSGQGTLTLVGEGGKCGGYATCPARRREVWSPQPVSTSLTTPLQTKPLEAFLSVKKAGGGTIIMEH